MVNRAEFCAAPRLARSLAGSRLLSLIVGLELIGTDVGERAVKPVACPGFPGARQSFEEAFDGKSWGLMTRIGRYERENC